MVPSPVRGFSLASDQLLAAGGAARKFFSKCLVWLARGAHRPRAGAPAHVCRKRHPLAQFPPPDLLEQQFHGGNGVLQVSASLTYDRTVHTPQVPAVVSNIRINGVPLDLAATYRVTVNNFLADGGDNYPVFREATNRFVGEIDLDAFARYIEFLGTVNPGPQNRINLIP